MSPVEDLRRTYQIPAVVEGQNPGREFAQGLRGRAVQCLLVKNGLGVRRRGRAASSFPATS